MELLRQEAGARATTVSLASLPDEQFRPELNFIANQYSFSVIRGSRKSPSTALTARWHTLRLLAASANCAPNHPRRLGEGQFNPD